jgi:hypothetical protein
MVGLAELYDPEAGTFTRTGVTVAGAAPNATLLPNGRVLIAGGVTYPFDSSDPPPALASAELFEE